MQGQSWLEAGAVFVALWTAMMVAMMLPSLVPMLGRYQLDARVCERLTSGTD
jgi:predicted metal-binding membrane protein